MAEVVGFEVQVRRDGRWETLATYGASEVAEARTAFEHVRIDGGATGVRLIEEQMDARGLFRSRTLGLRSAATGAAPATRPERRAAAVRPATPSAAGPARSGRSAAVPPSPAATGASRRPNAARSAKPGNTRFSFTELLGFLFTTVREAAAAGPAAVLPPPPEPVGRRGDLAVYGDELELPTVDLFTSDMIVREFHNFVEALETVESADRARANPRFVQGISLFTIGVLFSIEEHIDIFSQRGRTVVHACLRRFIDPVQTINHFVESLERYLRDEESAVWIRAGSRCFRFYRDADLRSLNREFGEAFGVYDRIERTVGGRVKVGILFTDIVDSTALTGALGDAMAQEVVDHHDATVERIAVKFGGRKVKHLGDGLMLCFGSAQAMAGCAAAIVDAMKGLAERPEVPPYRVRCGGHFGEAISKADDFFGSTVQLAARVAAAAAPNEARVCASIVEQGMPAFRRYEDCGAATLKGFEQPIVLARYR